MPKKKTVITAAAVVVSFSALAFTIIMLAANRVVGGELGLLMLVALFGLYFGFGVLIAVYRLVVKLE